MFCPKCGAQNPNGAKFCSGCGASLPHPAGAATAVKPSPTTPTQASNAKPRRSKKPFIIAAVAAAAVIAVAAAVRLIAPSSTSSTTPCAKPVSTMHLGLSTVRGGSKGDLDLGNEVDLGYSLNGDSISFIWNGTALKGKVQSTKQSGDSTVYEVGNLDYDGQDAGRSSSNLSAVKIYLFAPKDATTDNPVGQWGITTIANDGSAKNAVQHKLTVDKNGNCEYALSSASLGSNNSDALTADPTSDVASLTGGNTLISMNGSWTKSDGDGQVSVDLNVQVKGQDAGELAGPLELSDATYSSFADHYYPDGLD